MHKLFEPFLWFNFNIIHAFTCALPKEFFRFLMKPFSLINNCRTLDKTWFKIQACKKVLQGN